MTQAEKNRIIEILFYYFFSNKKGFRNGRRISKNKLDSQEFWNIIKYMNDLYDVDNITISKAIKILYNIDSNRPNELETIYLLNKAGFTVRDIVKITGMYFETQRRILSEIELTKPPVIEPKLTDVVMKRMVAKFMTNLIDFIDFFIVLDNKHIKNIFN